MEKEHNQAIRRYAAYRRGTRGGPPTPPAPGKFFNEQTFNDQTFNDQTFNDQFLMTELCYYVKYFESYSNDYR